MKKVYAIVGLLLAGMSVSYAQRNIDWSVSEVISPTEMTSNEQTGTVVAVHLVLKNNGTDAAKTGDSIAFQMVVTDPNNTPILAYPSTSALVLYPLKRDVPNGDTIHFMLNVSYQVFTRNSFNANFLVYSALWNRGGTDPVTMETDLANNRSTKSVVWWNPYKNGVGINSISAGALNIYPNPAQSDLTIQWPLASVNGETIISIIDMQGRVVLQTASTSMNGVEKVDISGLAKGLYQVEVSSGEAKMSSKLQVN